ncbi:MULTISPECIES: hypothetical protein [Cyanophyceae]|uniref:hypothetical protein n=1 Tax=Cyanophyceae TaxID=3028117 RepID=UPI00232F523A|nr:MULTISPECIES: hypothetical protein [Cyanophyceae]MDB9358232.1 hypothetical protein [Nodularia spumigena CS-587/03]MDB9320293.1 hypothetical protein [Nodularia spumigena CS-590/01A]MDB9323297.1 hypothetical protein [Nodularia spumigena CS-591/07A]MDB9327368.1 hypothetical protein [Nodularia spumigena CS-590/02]MDB9329593.1 hypothetical protein [Nodularia spumigena CS-591/04]
MEITKLWNISDNVIFYLAIAVVFVVATIIEVYTVSQYLDKTKAAINFLGNVKKGKDVKSNGQINEWLEKYLDPEDINIIRQQRQKIGQFILIKYPSALARPVPRTSLRFVTTLCTAIGVLGTFYGIQKGLQGINLSTEDTKQLMTASTELLAGMKTAFSTSLMGLGSGSLFTLVLFGSDVVRQKRRDSLRDDLKAIATLKTTENDNLEVAQALTLVAQQLTGFKQLKAEDIGQSVGRNIAEQFAGLNQLSAQAIGESVRQQILPLLRDIFNEQRRLRELQENQGQRVLEELINDLRIQVLEPIADRLDKSAELTQQASTAVLNLHQELGGISESLANSILTIQNFQQETLVQLQGFAHNLGDTLNDFKTDTRGVLQQTAHEINRAVNQSIEGMTAQRSAFKASADQAADTFRGIREELQTALQERAAVEQEMLQGFAHNMGQTLSQFKTETTGVLQQTSQEIHHAVDHSIQGMTAQRSAFEASAVHAADTFRGIREELQTALQERAAVEQQMLQATQTGIIRILTQANITFHEQTNTLKTVGEEASGLMNDAKDNLLATLGNIDERLTATRQTVEDDLTRFREEYQRNLQMFFEEQNTLLDDTLGRQQEGLSGVVNNLDQVFRDECQRRSELTQAVDASMTKIQESVAQINKLVIAAGLNDVQRLIQLEILARGIGEEVERVENSYRNLTQKFDDSLHAWEGHVQGSMEKTFELQVKFFQQADTAMSKVCGDLLRTAKVLVAANDNHQSGDSASNHG